MGKGRPDDVRPGVFYMSDSQLIRRSLHRSLAWEYIAAVWIFTFSTDILQLYYNSSLNGPECSAALAKPLSMADQRYGTQVNRHILLPFVCRNTHTKRQKAFCKTNTGTQNKSNTLPLYFTFTSTNLRGLFIFRNDCRLVTELKLNEAQSCRRYWLARPLIVDTHTGLVVSICFMY